MKEIDANIAERFGFLERCKTFECDLLKIKDITFDCSGDGVSFDLSGFLSNIYQVIIIPEYDIRADRNDYWDARKQLRKAVIELAEKYDLYPSGDIIEDFGEHFYFVFRCGKTWRESSQSKNPK